MVAPAAEAPRIRTADAVVSAVLLVVVAAVVAMGVLGGVFLLAFGECTPPRCNGDAAHAAVIAGLALAVVGGLGGLVLAVRRIALRRISWPFALVTLVFCAVVVVAAWAVYRLAVGT
ncbi:hypothetical protein ACQEVB_17855 [Pseudonocardia sp. CA-107938]|uniref:hypothetical protein n=1 Tax=Pseudonocardia sp. CA-107938 TaxID=3240021 RepID=UPI003D8D496D